MLDDGPSELFPLLPSSSGLDDHDHADGADKNRFAKTDADVYRKQHLQVNYSGSAMLSQIKTIYQIISELDTSAFYINSVNNLPSAPVFERYRLPLLPPHCCSARRITASTSSLSR